MSQVEIKTIKAPIPSKKSGCYDPANSVIYYVKLFNGSIVTKPEDYPPEASSKKK